MKEEKHQMVKNINRIDGFPLSTLSVMIGNNIITSEAAIQLDAVVKGITFGGTISAT